MPLISPSIHYDAYGCEQDFVILPRTISSLVQYCTNPLRRIFVCVPENDLLRAKELISTSCSESVNLVVCNTTKMATDPVATKAAAAATAATAAATTAAATAAT